MDHGEKMKKILWFCLVLAVAWGDEDAVELRKQAQEIIIHKGKLEKAFMLMEEAAELGDEKAIVMTGFMLEQGKGTEKDVIQAQMYYLRAVSEFNSAEALYGLGVIEQLYFKNEKRAQEYFALAASLGHMRAKALMDNI